MHIHKPKEVCEERCKNMQGGGAGSKSLLQMRGDDSDSESMGDYNKTSLFRDKPEVAAGVPEEAEVLQALGVPFVAAAAPVAAVTQAEAAVRCYQPAAPVA